MNFFRILGWVGVVIIATPILLELGGVSGALWLLLLGLPQLFNLYIILS